MLWPEAMDSVRPDTKEDPRPAPGGDSVDMALTRVFAGCDAVAEEIERLRSSASALSLQNRGSTSGAGRAGVAHALTQLQSREADLELACLALEGAIGRSAGDH
jgi:hypothetical protein